MALRLPETIEAAHMGHPDFRVGGKIFATLGYPRRGYGMVKLRPTQQEDFMRAAPDAFAAAKGAWGAAGATTVNLRAVKVREVREALRAAWRNHAARRKAKRG
jgi:hypothetical protein